MPRTVLITGCSDGGLGAALAVAFNLHGDRVFATARDPTKMASLSKLGIETLALDVLSEDSIKAAVEAVSSKTDGSLDVLVNNAGRGHCTPLLDADIAEVAKLFEINVFSYLRTTKLFFPLLRNARNGGLLVNNTSLASVMAVPFQGPYAATKAALASMTDALRQELQPFDIKVVDLKTGMVKSNFFANATSSGSLELGVVHLHPDSLYNPGKVEVEKFMRSDINLESMPADQWARAVVKDLSRKSPPPQAWNGGNTWQVWAATRLPIGLLDGMVKKMAGLDIVERYYHGLKAQKTK